MKAMNAKPLTDLMSDVQTRLSHIEIPAPAKKAGVCGKAIYTRLDRGFSPRFSILALRYTVCGTFAFRLLEVLVLVAICLIVVASVLFAFWTTVFSALGIGLLGLNLLIFICVTVAAACAAPILIGAALCIGLPVISCTFALGVIFYFYKSSPAASRLAEKLQQRLQLGKLADCVHSTPVGKFAASSFGRVSPPRAAAEEKPAVASRLPQILEHSSEMHPHEMRPAGAAA
eukprot:tig00020723_g13441.t1